MPNKYSSLTAEQKIAVDDYISEQRQKGRMWAENGALEELRDSVAPDAQNLLANLT